MFKYCNLNGSRLRQLITSSWCLADLKLSCFIVSNRPYKITADKRRLEEFIENSLSQIYMLKTYFKPANKMEIGHTFFKNNKRL